MKYYMHIEHKSESFVLGLEEILVRTSAYSVCNCDIQPQDVCIVCVSVGTQTDPRAGTLCNASTSTDEDLCGNTTMHVDAAAQTTNSVPGMYTLVSWVTLD